MTNEAEINVTGHGAVSAMPDCIQIDLTLESQMPDYPQTLADLNKRVRSIADAVSNAGVTESVMTKSYAIKENWSDEYDDDKRRFQGYKASQKMAVTIPLDTTMLGKVINELANSKACPSMSLSFVVKNMSIAVREARIAAANNAKEAANDLATAAGLQLVSVKSISYKFVEGNGGSRPLQMSALAQYDVSPAVNVKPDSIKHEESVSMVWLAIPIK